MPVVDTNAGLGGNQLLQRFLVEDFESAGEWSSFMPRDYGVTMAMLREGGPMKVTNDANKYVLGVKTEFMKRDWGWMTITPPKPIKIPGITKALNVWVVGRNYKHKMLIILRDFLGRMKFVDVEKLIWTGWKMVTIQIPLTIEQDNYKITEERGITFLGFRIDFDPEDILGTPFYIYFDYLTADTDVFTEVNQNPDDMWDNW
ncbi:MAG: hypothetical protein A2Y33_00405 [Spirochaetes bacterium GWF1_51_8]|nr:MAG: hypothetical protein A2Y33_00405 [Spirochaetes bacterium GWF1_51_8]